MKKQLSTLILCLGCLSGLMAQHLWKPINCEASWLGEYTNANIIGVSPNGDIFAGTRTAVNNEPVFVRSHDEGAQWEILGDFDVCTFMAFSPQGRIFFFPSEFADVYYSDDDCHSWYNTANHSVVNGQMIGACAVSNDTLLLWGQNQIDYTFDGGATWNTANLGFIEDYQSIGDLLVNENGDMYLCVWSYGGPGDGIYHSTISDMHDWQMIAAENYSIRDMAFDPEGNVVACGWNINGSIGFQHTSGFYLFDGHQLAISDNGIVYKMDYVSNIYSVLAYSLDHGETFTDHGEDLPLTVPAPGSFEGSLMKGCDNHLYFQGDGQCWKSIPNADAIPEFNPWIGVKFIDEASGLYFNIISDTTVEVTYDEIYINTGNNSYQGDIVIPETVTHEGITYTVVAVGDRAFNSCYGALTSVVVPNTVTSIGELAFAGSYNLRSVVLPNSVNTLGDRTFFDCQSLTSVRLPEGITVFPSGMFANCYGLSSMVIPPAVTRIESNAFGGSGLASIEIPESVTYIGEEAFASCSSLSSVDIPNSVTELGSGVFSYCTELRYIRLPENLVVIPSLLLNGCEDLTSITIPETVTQIETCAFLNCYSLTEIELPASVTALGESAFQNCRALESINIPETVDDWGNNVFLGCLNLRTLSLPQGMEAIPSGMFWGCTHLDSIVIPESVVTINGWAFSDCVDLREIVIPNNVISIGYGAFMGCDKLSKVELGESVSDLANNVFKKTNNGSVKLTLVCHNPVPAECTFTTFPDTSFQEKVITPCGFEEVYREAWSEYWQNGNFEEDCEFVGSEWYYEILNENGSLTYQHLRYAADTTVSHKDVKIIIRNNTLYDKGRGIEITQEYIYEEDNKVYWWNADLEDFTILYDFGAAQGDEWEIKVGSESIIVHVDAMEYYEYEGTLFKMLKVSDSQELFSGNIVCGIGHLTSFFPEKLMTQGKGYRVEGIRCFWQDGRLIFKYGDKDCDEVYEQYHHAVSEVVDLGFLVYPNPADGIITIEETVHAPSLHTQTYRITNMLGQTLLQGYVTAEKQQINIEALPAGMYFVTMGDMSQKHVLRHVVLIKQ